MYMVNYAVEIEIIYMCFTRCGWGKIVKGLFD